MTANAEDPALDVTAGGVSGERASDGFDSTPTDGLDSGLYIDAPLDPTAGGRAPWGPSELVWGKPPLSPQTWDRMAAHARYCRQRRRAASVREILAQHEQLVEMVLLLVEDTKGYDIVDPIPDPFPPLDHPDGGRRAD